MARHPGKLAAPRRVSEANEATRRGWRSGLLRRVSPRKRCCEDRVLFRRSTRGGSANARRGRTIGDRRCPTRHFCEDIRICNWSPFRMNTAVVVRLCAVLPGRFITRGGFHGQIRMDRCLKAHTLEAGVPARVRFGSRSRGIERIREFAARFHMTGEPTVQLRLDPLPEAADFVR